MEKNFGLANPDAPTKEIESFLRITSEGLGVELKLDKSGDAVVLSGESSTSEDFQLAETRLMLAGFKPIFAQH